MDEYDDVGTHWIALYVRNICINNVRNICINNVRNVCINNVRNSNNCIYFDSFGVEYIPNEIKNFIGNKDTISTIFRLQAYDSIMCGYFCINFIDYMLKNKTLLDFTDLFSPYDFKKNDEIITEMFK